MNQPGKLIVIEGLDGSGKATQSALLADALRSRDERVLSVSFPDYQSESSALVRMYLSGALGAADEVNAYAASGFYAADRYISYVTRWRKEYLAGYTILADRYTTSNAAHQMSKLPLDEWDSYLDWLVDCEFTRMGLPPPDLVIYLDMQPEASRKLLRNRYAETGGGQDIHEANHQYLLACRQAALYAAERLDWRVIDCCLEDEPLPVEAVASKIRAILDSI